MQPTAIIHLRTTPLWTVHEIFLPQSQAKSEVNSFNLAVFYTLIERNENVIIDALVFQGDEPNEYFGLLTPINQRLPFGYYGGWFASDRESYLLSCSWRDLEAEILLEAINSGAIFTFAGSIDDLIGAAHSIPEISLMHEDFWLNTSATANSLTSFTFFGHDGNSVVSYTQPQMTSLPWQQLLEQANLRAVTSDRRPL